MSTKVRLLLAQLGIAYRRVDTTQNRGEPATAEFRAINPIGGRPSSSREPTCA
jgi:glutathione S-transferase